jgi:serine/threonine protein phosphatase 1
MKQDAERNHSEGRLFAIGDAHACSTALGTLIEAIGPRPDDTIVTLGDYIDWGRTAGACSTS